MNADFLSSQYWNNRYLNHEFGWDVGKATDAFTKYADSILDKSKSILIPGCGNGYEAQMLLEKGFQNITVIDFAAIPINKMKLQFENNTRISIIEDDFFNHKLKYDFIFEQTFFCAIEPNLRKQYVAQTAHLLNDNGKLVGLLFDKNFENSPPFGGSKAEYQMLFEVHFTFLHFENCYNSIPARAGTELFIEFLKK